MAEMAALEAYLGRVDESGLSPIERYAPEAPHPRQVEYLALDTREALYGGQAGGGKSSCLLMAALQYVDVKGYAALLLRRTFPDLTKPGALLDRAREWLVHTDAVWEASTKTWHFRGGGSLTFGYLETDADRFIYQGAEFQFIGFDELTQFTELQYTYLLSRLRRPPASTADLGTVPLRMRAATNPGGIGHRWVMERFGLRLDGTQEPGHHRPFVPARLDENPGIDVESYRESLAETDSTTRDQLERGLWIPDGQGRIYPYDRLTHGVETLPEREGWRKILAVDFGASEATPTTSFSVLIWHPHDPVTYIAESYVRAALDVTGTAEEVRTLVERYDGFDVIVGDQGALGVGYIREFRFRHQIPMVPAEKREKLAARKLFRGAMERGHVKVLWPQCEELEREYETLVWDRHGRDAAPGLADHCSDGVLYGWRASRAHASRAPDQRPAPGTRAADRAEAERIKQAERRRYEERQRRPAWESW
jgi:hypothetical protein